MNPDDPIRYIDRTRAYYEALGYSPPYRWARFDEVPFTPLGKPLSECRIAIVTTAAPYQPDKGDQGPGAAYNAAAKFYSVYALPIDPTPELRISHVAIDRDHTTAEDPGSYFPLAALRRAEQQGLIGAIGPHVFGLPTNRSQATTIGNDCPEILRLCVEDRIDAAVLVPNCPVCHQSTALAARALESSGIATVIMGCALDIVEHAGAPRFLFSDFPLGNSAGRPGDSASQAQTMALALDLLVETERPRMTRRSPLKWLGEAGWKDSYSNASRLGRREIAQRRNEFDKAKIKAASLRNEAND